MSSNFDNIKNPGILTRIVDMLAKIIKKDRKTERATAAEAVVTGFASGIFLARTNAPGNTPPR